MKYFIVSDVHGFYDELHNGLEDAGFDLSNPEHIFVSLGDLFDRGNKNCDCIEFVNNLPVDRKILLWGNHEFYLQDAISRGYFKSFDRHNCTDKTCTEFYLSSNDSEEVLDKKILYYLKEWSPIKKYLDSLDYYKIVGDNLFVHGWVPYWCRNYDDLNHTDWIDWYDAVWDNGPKLWNNGYRIWTSARKDKKLVTVFCGHIHSFIPNRLYHNNGEFDIEDIKTVSDILKMDNSPFIDEGIVNLDTCTEVTHKVNVFALEF